MDKLINNPVLQHISENIFLNLDNKDIMNCQKVNQSCQQILTTQEMEQENIVQGKSKLLGKKPSK